MNDGELGASAAATLQMLNQSEPMRNMSLLPKISASRPHSKSKQPLESLVSS